MKIIRIAAVVLGLAALAYLGLETVLIAVKSPTVPWFEYEVDLWRASVTIGIASAFVLALTRTQKA